jgi:hypothetical protein
VGVLSFFFSFFFVLGDFKLDLKLRDIKAVMLGKSLLFVNNGIEISKAGEKEKLFFAVPQIGHRDEAIVLIKHLLHHPVTIFSQTEEEALKIEEELNSSKIEETTDQKPRSAALEFHIEKRVVEVPILEKLPNDSLRFSQLNFAEKTFKIQNAKNFDYFYENIDSVGKFQIFLLLFVCLVLKFLHSGAGPSPALGHSLFSPV